jgi:alpha-L-rhamnosidase
MNSGKLTTKTRLSARYLRHQFSLNDEVKRAHLYISGLGLYECYINGKKISNDIFAPTATDYTKRVNYNVFEVKDFLSKSANTIGVILGNGRFFSMRMENVAGGEPLDVSPIVHYGFPKLLMQLEVEYKNGKKKTITSNTSWKISTDGPIVANNEFDGEEYMAELEMPGWNTNGFNDKSWLNAKKVAAPEGKLVAQLNPNIATMREIKPLSVKQITKGRYILDMGQNMVGWLAIKLKGNAGQPITIRYAETLQKDGNLYTANLRGSRNSDIYTPANNGVFLWEPRFVYHGFRFVEITGIDYRPSMGDFIGKVNYDAMKNIGTFETSNATINKVYKNALWGIMGNYRSMPTDCPQRDERMGWLGDRATGCFGESFMFDNQLLYAKWAQDIHDSQKDSGSLPDVAPAYWAYYTDNITWPAAYIHVANMLYEQYGDERPIKLHYESMKKWLDYMQVKYMKDYIMTKDQYGDWCMPPENLNIIFSKDSSRITNGEILSTTFFYRLLNIMAKYAAIVGHENDKQEFLNLGEKVKAAYNNKFFNKESAGYGNNTVTANIISLMQGLVPDGYEHKVFNNLVNRTEGEFKSHVSVGLIGIQFLMRGLTAYGRPDLAYRIATNRTYPSWGYMAENGATTIWELWNGNTADPAMNSGNHLMLLGDLLTWYYENLAGIQSDKIEVAFKKIVMKPVFPAGLNFVKASHQSPYGLIKSEWTKKGTGLTWKVTIPPNTTAVIDLPTKELSVIKNNGKAIVSNENMAIIKGKEMGTQLQIGSGEYNLEITNAKFD